MTCHPRFLEGTPFNLFSGTGIKTLSPKQSKKTLFPSISEVCLFCEMSVLGLEIL